MFDHTSLHCSLYLAVWPQIGPAWPHYATQYHNTT